MDAIFIHNPRGVSPERVLEHALEQGWIDKSDVELARELGHSTGTIVAIYGLQKHFDIESNLRTLRGVSLPIEELYGF